MKSAVGPSSDGAAAATLAPGESSLESFVAQLHREGVAAGQRDADQLVREARLEAGEILRRAQAEAEALLADTRDRSLREEERARAELELAARDTMLQLESALDQVLNTILQRAVERVLRDRDFLVKLVSETVKAYARADAVARPTALHLPHDMARQLEAWTAQALAAGLQEDLEVRATLRQAGFEYRLSDGGAIEVSTASVVERLLDLVRPRLREIVVAAAQAPAPQREAPHRVGGSPPGPRRHG